MTIFIKLFGLIYMFAPFALAIWITANVCRWVYDSARGANKDPVSTPADEIEKPKYTKEEARLEALRLTLNRNGFMKKSDDAPYTLIEEGIYEDIVKSLYTDSIDAVTGLSQIGIIAMTANRLDPDFSNKDVAFITPSRHFFVVRF